MDSAPTRPDQSHQLGSLLSTNPKKTGQCGSALWFISYAGFALAFMSFLSEMVYHQQLQWDGCYFGIFMLTLSIWNFMTVRSSKDCYLRVFEEGIEIQQRTKVQRFRFSMLESMAFNSVRKFVNGAYVGHEYQMAFVVRDEDRTKTLKWSSIDNDPQVGLEELRQQVSLLLANKLNEKLESTGVVEWGDRVSIQKEAILFKPFALWTNSLQPQSLLFRDIERCEHDELGRLLIYRSGDRNPALIILNSEPNFYPGHILFSALREQSRQPRRDYHSEACSA
jgi:hypothetical protein